MSKITFPRKPDIKPKHALFKFGMLTDTGRHVQIEGELPRHVLSEVERMLWLPEPTYLLVVMDAIGNAKPIFCLDKIALTFQFAKAIGQHAQSDADLVLKHVEDLIETRFFDNGAQCIHLYLLREA